MKDVVLNIKGNPVNILMNYRYLWAKYVYGFKEKYHCAKSLKGTYSNLLGIPPANTENLVFNEVAEWDYIYLCGVHSSGYDYNFHLPVQYKEGSTASVESTDGLIFTFTNAEALIIPSLPDGFKGLSKRYTTCRNFQFGYECYGKEDLFTNQ